MSLALVGRFLITRPPGKPKVPLFYDKFAITLTSPFPELLIHSEFVSFLILQVLFVPSPPLSIPTRFQALGEQETTSHFLPQFQYNAQPKYSQYTVAGRFLSSFCPLIFSSFRPWQSRHVLCAPPRPATPTLLRSCWNPSRPLTALSPVPGLPLTPPAPSAG